jgi:WD40 repeat protein
VWSVAWSRDEQRDVVVTGSVDTVVKAWQADADGKLSARHKLEGHRLGVVSVDVNRAGTGKAAITL